MSQFSKSREQSANTNFTAGWPFVMCEQTKSLPFFVMCVFVTEHDIKKSRSIVSCSMFRLTQQIRSNQQQRHLLSLSKQFQHQIARMSTIKLGPSFDLAQKWKQLCQLQKQESSDSNDNLVVEQWWKTIVQRHSEEHRAYHTLNHLKELFQWFERFEHLLPQDADRRLVVQWSIFFHE